MPLAEDHRVLQRPFNKGSEDYAARTLTFCQNIYHSSEDEWKRIVRAALLSADARRPASYVVMKSLHDELCKDG